MFENKKILFIVLPICLLIIVGLFLVFHFSSTEENDTKEESLPEEITDVLSIVKNINVLDMELDKEYDFKILSKDSKCIMLINYMELKGLFKDTIDCSKFEEISKSFYGEVIDYDNLLLTIEKHVYQKDGNSIKRFNLEYGEMPTYNVDLDNYDIDKENIIVDVKINAEVQAASISGNKIIRYSFVKDGDSYSLNKIKLLEDFKINVDDE